MKKLLNFKSDMDHPFKIYQSSAGSGKTYTLVKEYIGILLKNDNVSKFKQILAVTFTNKAANEMKERVLDALVKLFNTKDKYLLSDYSKHTGLSESEIVVKAESVFLSIIHQYGYFNILTIDKFVHRVIRSFSRELDLSVNFEVESDIDTFLKRSIASLLQQVGSNEELTAYLVKYAEELLEGEDNDDVEKSLLKLTYLLKESGSKEVLKNFESKDLTFFSKLNKKLVEDEDALKERQILLAQELIVVLEGNGWDPCDFGSRKGSGWNALLNKYIVESQIDVGDDKKFGTLKNQVAENKWYKKSYETLVNQVGGQIIDVLQRFIEIESELRRIRLIKKQLVGFSLLNTVGQLLQQVKADNNIVFLNDFNEIISKIVQQEPAPFVYEKIGTRFRHFLVDEFQDTSVLQWNNMVPLFYDSLSEGNENLIVGDPKQAIYRWRGGEVNQFVQLPQVTGEFTYLSEINRVFDHSAAIYNLKVNYRSAQEIISFNNWLFKILSDRTEGSIKKIYEAVEQEVHKGEQGYVRVKIIEEEKKQDFQEKTLNLLFEYLSESFKDGYRLGDIGILVRTKNEGTAVAEFLEKKGYPVVSSDSIVLGSSSDVQFIISFLKAMDNLADEHALVNCLRFLSGQEHLTEDYEKWSFPDQYSGIDFLGYLSSNYLMFDEAYYHSLNLYDRVVYIMELFNLNRYDPYLDQLLNTTHKYKPKNGSDISAFISYIEDKKDKIAVNLGNVSNAIQVMTIHKSKGLQFPVVMLPFGSWKDKPGGPAPLTWIEHEHLRDLDLPGYVNPLSISLEHFGLSHLVEQEKNETLLDNINLFYVAFTRPENRLYVNFYKGPKKLGGVSETIMTLCAENCQYREDKGELIYGVREKYASQSTEDLPVYKGKEQRSKRATLAISFDPEAFMDEPEKTSEKEVGLGVHAVLAKIGAKGDVELVIDELIRQGIILSDNKEMILNMVHKVFEMEITELFFNEHVVNMNEAEIIAADGSLYRPDKVLIEGEEAIIIDFKTGVKRNSHVVQLNKYAELIEEMGYVVKNKYLFYVAEPTLIEI